jgi:hypothetical protein
LHELQRIVRFLLLVHLVALAKLSHDPAGNFPIFIERFHERFEVA